MMAIFEEEHDYEQEFLAYCERLDADIEKTLNTIAAAPSHADTLEAARKLGALLSDGANGFSGPEEQSEYLGDKIAALGLSPALRADVFHVAGAALQGAVGAS
jgi:hypothetical protein